MSVTKLNRLLALTVLSAVLATAAYASISDHRDWAKPGLNVEKGQIQIKITLDASPLLLSNSQSVVVTGVKSLDEVAATFGVSKIQKTFVSEVTPPKDSSIPDLSRYYTVFFPQDLDPTMVGEAYEACKEVIFAEYVPIRYQYFTPNDPRYHTEWHLEHCGFPAAWDVTHGSRDIVIGIVDGGMDMPFDDLGNLQIHEDIAGNIWQNPGEDINHDGQITFDDWNGRDDDGDGFADDFWGWDLTSNDNVPNDEHATQPRAIGHGTHVAGIASATTNNNLGVSGAAFSASIMVAACYHPQYDSLIANGPAGIVYCAKAGANIINMSWGSLSPDFQSERDAVNFALAHGCIIFAAMGNDGLVDRQNDRNHHYPVSYPGVIGVASSNSADDASDFTTYGDFVDLVAPGEGIISTIPHNQYTPYDGTSMASPLSAGLGALLLSVKPNLTAAELLAKMQATATDISARNQDKLGIRYRINADVLLNSTHPHFQLLDWELRDIGGNNDGRADPGEHVAIDFTIQADAVYADAIAARATLTNTDPKVDIESATAELGDMGGDQQFHVGNNDAPRFFVHENSLPHYNHLTLTISEQGGYSQAFDLSVTIGHPYYLLVDDDDGANFQSYYLNDLNIRPVVHDTWTVSTQGSPSLATLQGYNFIYWETGTARNALSAAEQTTLSQYLDGGQRRALFISGQYLGEDIGNTNFYSNYLHAHYLGTTNGQQLLGVAGDPISAGVDLLLLGGSGAGDNMAPSSITPINGADTLLTYTNENSEVGAIHFESADYSVVYLGFALEAASGQSRTTTRADFLQRVADRFKFLPVKQEAPPASPTTFSLAAPWPNPFNPQTAITVAAPAGKPYRLEVLDLNGRKVATLNSGAAAGSKAFVWNGDTSPAGIYIIRLSWNGGSVMQKAALVK